MVKKVDDDTALVGTAVDSDDEMDRFTTATRPGLRQILANRDPGDEVVRLDFDPYWVSMRFVSTHVLARALEEGAVREAVRAGHVYVSHDWIADPTGFRFYLAGDGGASAALMGDQAEWRPGARLVAELPVAARVRLLRDGGEIAFAARGDRFEHAVESPASTGSRPGSRSAASGGPGSIRTRSTSAAPRRPPAPAERRVGSSLPAWGAVCRWGACAPHSEGADKLRLYTPHSLGAG